MKWPALATVIFVVSVLALGCISSPPRVDYQLNYTRRQINESDLFDMSLYDRVR